MSSPKDPKTALETKDILHFVRKYTNLATRKTFLSEDDAILQKAHVDDWPPYTFMLINTAEKSDKEGEHWVSLTKFNDCLYYFDSLGLDTQNSHFEIGSIENGTLDSRTVKLLNKRLCYQYSYNYTCGQYQCLFGVALGQALQNGTVVDYETAKSTDLMAQYGLHPSRQDTGLQKRNDNICLNLYNANK